MYPALMLAFVAHADPATDAPPAGVDAVHRALSARDGAPPCEDVEALAEDPVAALLYITAHAPQPPWAGVRAAECLVSRHAADIQPELTQWVQQSETRGFALVVFNGIGDLPSEVSVPLAQAALAGPLVDDARPRLEGIENAEIKLLLEESQQH